MTDQDSKRLMEHSYDGIQEYDNPLPRWWVWIFYATIVFAVVYAFEPTGRLRGPGRVNEYKQQLADAAARWPAPSAATSAASIVELERLSKDAATIAAGKTVFTTTCAACHGPDGGGVIGPNLTDDFWIHGSSLAEIHHTISEGVLDKGMPNWGKMLKPEQVNAVAVYVASLRGTHPANPKAPQGTKDSRAGSATSAVSR